MAPLMPPRMFWLGVLFVLIVSFFPQGLFGWLRQRR